MDPLFPCRMTVMLPPTSPLLCSSSASALHGTQILPRAANPQGGRGLSLLGCRWPWIPWRSSTSQAQELHPGSPCSSSSKADIQQEFLSLFPREQKLLKKTNMKGWQEKSDNKLPGSSGSCAVDEAAQPPQHPPKDSCTPSVLWRFPCAHQQHRGTIHDLNSPPSPSCSQALPWPCAGPGASTSVTLGQSSGFGLSRVSSHHHPAPSPTLCPVPRHKCGTAGLPQALQ